MSGYRPRRFAVALATLFLALPARAEQARVVLLHTTDLHGRLVPDQEDGAGPGPRGLARIATYVKRVRAEGAPVVLVDAGDCLQGSPLVTVHQTRFPALPEPMTSAMNLIGFDAMAVGNHEFDFGLEPLRRARANARYPFLSANVVDRGSGRPAFLPWKVIAAGGVRIGLVGITTPAVPGWLDSTLWRGLRFDSPVEAARAAVATLRGTERCDVVVVVAHTGFERDPVRGDSLPGQTPGENWAYAIARNVPGVDVLVMGHTHVSVPSATVGGALCTQAGRWAEQVGRVELTLERGAPRDPWHLTSRSAALVAMTADAVPPDSALMALARPYVERTRAALAERLGTSSRELASPDARAADSPVWRLVHEAQLQASGAEVSLSALFDPRARLRPGPVTVGDVMRLYPYENTLVTVELTGAELTETLENAARCFRRYRYEAGAPALFDPDMPGYNYDGAYGVTYEIDLTQPAGDRIRNLRFRGQPVAPESRFKVVTNSYRVSGGGGYAALARAPRLWRSERGAREILVDYVRAQGVPADGFTPAWRILPDLALAPERPLLDRLVRLGGLTGADTLRLDPEVPAHRGDFVYWLARAFGWREKRRSNAYADVPDSLSPWLEALLRRRVLGAYAAQERQRPFDPLPPTLALEWAEGAARAAGYALGPRDPSGLAPFRAALLTGVGRPGRHGSGLYPGVGDSLTRAEALALIANLRFPWIRLLSTNDFHGAIATTRDRRTDRPWGGSPVLAAWIDSLRGVNPFRTVLLDGGDLFQGSMSSNLQYGRPVVEQMNALGYAATAIGNHEFDWTVDTLVRRISELRCKALGANIVERKTRRRPRWAGSDTSLVRSGVRIAVIGVATPETPLVTLGKYVAHLDFLPPAPIVNRRVPGLRRAGASVVVVIGHIPGKVDSTGAASGDVVDLAREVRGEDAVLGGHSHLRLLTRVEGTPTLVAASHGQAVGVVDLIVDPVRRRVAESDARLVTTYADAIRPDTAMARRVARWDAAVEQVGAVRVGRNDTLLTRVSGGESTLGDFVTDAMRRAVPADVAMQNTGGLRADLPAGVVNRRHVYEVMPFDNTISEVVLTGSQVKQVLEEGLAHDLVTQVSGLRYRMDGRRPPGDRVTELQDENGQPLRPDAEYKVLCNNFMAGGGDYYATFARGKGLRDTGITVRGALEDLIADREKRGLPLSYRLQGRITGTR